MPTCPQCGSAVPDGAVYCGKCGATLNPAAFNSSTSVSTTSQTGTPQQTSSTWPSSGYASGESSMRLEKAMKRAEMLGYAAVGLAVVILVVLLLLTL